MVSEFLIPLLLVVIYSPNCPQEVRNPRNHRQHLFFILLILISLPISCTHFYVSLKSTLIIPEA